MGWGSVKIEITSLEIWFTHYELVMLRFHKTYAIG